MDRDDSRVAASGPANAQTDNAATLADLFGAAVARHQAGKLVEAEQLYRQVLAREAAHADSLHNLGLIALQRGAPAAAAELIGQAIAANGDAAEFHYNNALALRALGRASDAEAALARALAIRENYPAAHLNLGNLRREQGRLAEAAAAYERALALAPQFAEARFNLANVLAEQGRSDAAIAAYRQVLASHPNHAESHTNLGAALLAQGKNADAIGHFERALALKPNLLAACNSLGRALLAAGQVPQAMAAARRALALQETQAGKEFFAQCARFMRFTADDGTYRPWLLRAVDEAWARPSELVRVTLSLVKLNDAVGDATARAAAAWPARLPAPELFGPAGAAGIAADRLLCRLLQSAALTDVGIERLLTGARAVLLTLAQPADSSADAQAQLEFWCALAQQCFINEYIYDLTPAEAERAERLRAALAQRLDTGEAVPAIWPAAVGAYFPLHELPQARALLDRDWPDAVAGLLAQQIKEPLEERSQRATIPALTGVAGDVAHAVRQQYEENPYPRWVKAGPPTEPVRFDDPDRSIDVLIAGCGTGQFTIEFARQARTARFLAVDLSRASLGYAKRMASAAGLDNIEFVQADIAALGNIGKTFDVIEAGGMLHHLADPWQGWRALLSLLRPGGIMLVGLYSALARQGVVAARALIAERGFPPTPEGIRRCRAELMAAADGTPLKSLTVWHDFYTTSECRDLLFHPQEHQFTLPQIKAFLTENGLHFAGFVLDTPIEQRFGARFPGRAMLTDLDRWHTYETEHPGTFASMYQFWVQKPGAAGVTAKLQ